MILDPVTMSGFGFDDFFSDQYSTMSSSRSDDSLFFLNQDDYGNLPSLPLAPTPGNNRVVSPSSNFSSTLTTARDGGGGGDSPEDSEIFSDIVLNYISRMLMEEDVDEKINLLYQEKSAIHAAEKPFYDILREKYPPSPVRSSSVDSPDDTNNGSVSTSSSSSWVSVSCESSSHSSFSPCNSSGSVVEPSEDPTPNVSRVSDLFFESPAWQFQRGVEEAQKFLPSDGMLLIDLEAESQQTNERRSFVKVKTEKEEREYLNQASRVRKNPNRKDLDLDLVEGRSNKQSAVYSGEAVRSEIFDMVLLCNGDKGAKGINALREAMQNEASKNSQSTYTKGSGGGKARGKKQTKKEVVDLRTLLIHCAQAVSTDDRRNANELLKQIRHYASPFGDGSQRLANCFADGLEARLAGTGSQIYQSLVAKRTTATDILKAYQLYLAACPFKKISHFFSNQTILNVAENASRVHIIDFGIYFGFQWPCLIQRLSSRPGGPPKLRITGVDVPQPGFRPTERIEETGKRLADYARSFNVPFEYNAIASKWEKIRVKDLKIDKDEVLIVNCLYRFRNLVDETVVVDSPRDTVLKTIRKANPDVFIHGIVNGSYSAPFFVTRFREALFHFSALFDMLETNVPREDAQRMLIERDLFGREALNVVSCEGAERVERPETFKQWQVRNIRAGFTQLPLDPDIMKRAMDKVKGSYHKDFVTDEDSGWLLQGWKGRIIYAISTWKPNKVC